MTKKTLHTIKLSGKLLALLFCLVTISKADVIYEISNTTSVTTKVNIFSCAENKKGKIEKSSTNIWAQIWLDKGEKWKIEFPKGSPKNQYICAETTTGKWNDPNVKTLIMGVGQKRQAILNFRIIE